METGPDERVQKRRGSMVPSCYLHDQALALPLGKDKQRETAHAGLCKFRRNTIFP